MLKFYKWVAVLLMTAGAALAQDFGDTPYVQTPMNVVERMLQIAKVNSRDYVIDLGSGDGRMVLTAAKKYGARGFGVDLDRRLVELANRTAAKTGVADRAAFYERDLYETDFSAATVMTGHAYRHPRLRHGRMAAGRADRDRCAGQAGWS